MVIGRGSTHDWFDATPFPRWFDSACAMRTIQRWFDSVCAMRTIQRRMIHHTAK